MSIGSSPFQGGGAASIADATETTAGKIRIATSTEAETGTNDLIAMTPLTVKERIDAALVGGVEYKGTFNATAGTPSLANAEKGDLYIIDTAGTIYGQTWAVGDHLLINDNMGGSIDSSKIDKVDNTDAVSSVNSLTGAVVLDGGNISADYTATSYIASSANINGHLEGIDDEFLLTAPLASPALTGTPTAPTATSGTNTTQIATTAFVTTAVAGAGGISSVVEDTTPQLGGNLDVNGQTITSASSGDVTIDPDGTGDVVIGADIMPDANATHFIGDENTRFISAYTDINGAIRFKAKNDQGASITKGQAVYIKGISGTVPTVGLAQANSASSMPAFGLALENANDQAEVQVITFGNLPDVNTTTYSLSAGDTVYVSATAAGSLTNSAPAGESNLIQNIGRVVRADASAGIIKVGGAGRSNATPNLDQDKIFVGDASNQAVSTALSAINLSKFNNDLSGLGNQINALQVKTSASYTAQANYVYIGGYTSGTQTITMPAASGATSGDIIGFTSNVASRALSLVSSDGTTNDVINQSNQAKGGSNGALSLTVNQQISWFIHNGTSWYEANAAPSAVTTSGAYSDLSGTPTLATVATTGAYSDLSGTPTLATVATTGAYSDLSGTPTLATVATTGAYSDLSGTPTLGTAAAADTGDFLASTAGLNDLADVSFTAGAGIDNYILTYDNSTTSWGAEAAPTAAAASETTAGVIEIATNAEATGATATDKALVPSNLSSINVGTLNNDAGYITSAPVSSVNTLTGAVVLSANDLAADHTAVNYTAVNANIDGHLSGIDTALASAGGGGWTYSAITADPSTAQTGYHYSCSGTFSVTLPAAAAGNSGKEIRVKNMGTGTITIARTSGNIEGTAADYTLDVQFSAVTLISNGSNGWEII